MGAGPAAAADGGGWGQVLWPRRSRGGVGAGPTTSAISLFKCHHALGAGPTTWPTQDHEIDESWSCAGPINQVMVVGRSDDLANALDAMFNAKVPAMWLKGAW